MSFKYPFIFLIYFLSLNLFSQQKINIIGNIKSGTSVLSDVIVKLDINKFSKFAVSDKNGNYKFSNIIIISTDSLVLKINYSDFENLTKKIENLQSNNIFDINLIEQKTNKLNEVIITGEAKIINKVNKSIYKINSKDFIKNAKAEEVLNTVPNLYSNQGLVIVNGKLPAKLFIDGLEMMNNELNTIDASEIDKVEVNANPSASYGSEFTGAIVNIISKIKTEEFIKGNIGTTAGVKNNFWTVEPYFSFKRGKFIIKSTFSHKEYKQQVDTDLNRIENNNVFFQKNVNNSHGIQKFFQTRLNIKLSGKSNINFSSSLFGYKFIGNANGYSNLNNSNIVNFLRKGEESNVNWNISSVYKYKINENKALFIKSKYYKYTDTNDFTIIDDFGSQYFDIQSKNKEFSSTIDYEAEDIVILKKTSSLYTGLKYINRNFSFSNTNFFINQDIINGNLELDTEWTEKFSTEFAFAIENTRNYNTILNKSYILFLPTANVLYHFKNKIDAKLEYSKKILRPDADELNDNIIISYPGFARQGNSNLNVQNRDYTSFEISKAFKSDNVSLRIYNESINNAIVETYKTQGTLLIKFLDNAAKYNSTGISLGFRTKLFKKINANLNSGFDYNVFEDNSPIAIIKKNSGYTFKGNLSLSTKLFKDKVAISFSGRQNGPEYSLLSKKVTSPYLDFTLKTNLFKDKLSLQFYIKSLLGDSALGFSDIGNYSDFYQRIETKNNSSNFLFTLTYNFGKKFNDKIDDNNIENNDVRR